MSVATTEPASRTAFHLLTVAAVEQLTDDAVAVTFDVPDELRDAVRLRCRSVAHAAADDRRGRAPPYLFDLRARGQSPADRRTRDPRRPLLLVARAPGAAGRPDRGAGAVRQLPRGSAAGWPPSLHRRRVRHHADAVGRGVGAVQPRGARDASLRQPGDDVGDVRGGARRPQGRATTGASTSSTCSRANRVTSSCSPGASTPSGCARCSRALVPVADMDHVWLCGPFDM